MSTLRTVYLVVGECGSYDDRSTWNVKAFSSKKKAQLLVRRLRVRVSKIMTTTRAHSAERAALVKKSREYLDPQMEVFDDGPIYNWTSLSLLED